MGLYYDISKDLDFLSYKFGINKVTALLFNRGIHALIVYRLANRSASLNIPLIPLILTRIVQILYSIDISWKCKIEGGIIIIHGVGLVIGEGTVIEKGCILYHGVTLGRKYQISEKHPNDGFPSIRANCVLGAGAKLIGNIQIGENTIVSPNVVLFKSVGKGVIVKNVEPVIITKNNKKK
ncbi:serine O-acetyltransferase [Leeuwenhoekiella sp. A16]|uniref:serine O-acetyltransferase n=1 Tax=Leeuwenhoekiella sp. A16 TaxID=3141462 RepID=UPI003A80F047